jgi:hypothetical protein
MVNKFSEMHAWTPFFSSKKVKRSLILDVKSIYMAPIHLIDHTDQENTVYKVLVISLLLP